MAASLASAHDAILVLVVAAHGEVIAVHVARTDGSVLGREPWGGQDARVYAAKIRSLAGDAPPDLGALLARVVGMSEGCEWVEAEMEIEEEKLIAEVECRHGGIEVELALDPRDGRLIGLEVEAEDGEEDDEEDEAEDGGLEMKG